MKSVAVLTLIALAGLAGCVTTGVEPGGRDFVAPQPIAQQVPSGDLRVRAKTHTDLGLAYLNVRRPSQALDEARIAINLDTTYPLAYNLMGLVFMELKDNNSADDAFRRALSYAPADPEISNNYGWFLCQTGKDKQSQPHFRAAYLNPLFNGVSLAMTNAAICADKGGDLKLADQMFSTSLQRDPGDSRTLLLYAEFLYRNGRNGEARLRLNDLQRVGDSNARVVWLALRVARRLGDRAEEARYTSILRQRFADSPEFELMQQGRFE